MGAGAAAGPGDEDPPGAEAGSRGDPAAEADRRPDIARFGGTEAEARRRLCGVGGELYLGALLGGRAGNLSVRLDSGRLLVTPRGSHKGRLDPEELVVVPAEEADPSGRDATAHDPGEGPGAPTDAAPAPEAEATSELPFHRAVYRARPDVAAVLHTHAPALTAAGVRGVDVTAPFPEIEEALGTLARVPFRPSGSRALADAVAEAAERAEVLLLERHGALALGATPEEARDRMELAELTAWAALLAEDAGLGLDLGRLAELHGRIVGRAKGG